MTTTSPYFFTPEQERKYYLRKRLQESTEEQVFTAADAQMLGVDLAGYGEGWADLQVYFSPDENKESGFAVSYTTPDGFRVFDDESLMTPDGVKYDTLEDYNDYLNLVSLFISGLASVGIDPTKVAADNADNYYSWLAKVGVDDPWKVAADNAPLDQATLDLAKQYEEAKYRVDLLGQFSRSFGRYSGQERLDRIAEWKNEYYEAVAERDRLEQLVNESGVDPAQTMALSLNPQDVMDLHYMAQESP